MRRGFLAHRAGDAARVATILEEFAGLAPSALNAAQVPDAETWRQVAAGVAQLATRSVRRIPPWTHEWLLQLSRGCGSGLDGEFEA